MRSDRNRGQIKQLVLLAAIAIAGLPAWPAKCQNRPVLVPSPTSSAGNSATTKEARNTTETQSEAPTKDIHAVAETQNPGATPDSSNYVIGSDDVLNVHVWHQTEISGPVTVRPDGKISLPLIGEMPAGGLTPPQLQSAISDKLRAFVNEPEVTVIVQQSNSKKFNVLGRVERPGSYSLATRMRVLDGIAAAGGFSDFAKVSKIYVLRPTSSNGVQRLPFNYKRITQNHDTSENVDLQAGDTVVVP